MREKTAMGTQPSCISVNHSLVRSVLVQMKAELIYASFENTHCCQLVLYFPSNNITSKKKKEKKKVNRNAA